jgi:hypothetical protein
VVHHPAEVFDQVAFVLEEDPSSFLGHDSVENAADVESAAGVDGMASIADADANCVVFDFDFVAAKALVVICIATQTRIYNFNCHALYSQ